MEENIIITMFISLTLVYYTCSSKPTVHVDDCFEFKLNITHVGKM